MRALGIHCHHWVLRSRCSDAIVALATIAGCTVRSMMATPSVSPGSPQLISLALGVSAGGALLLHTTSTTLRVSAVPDSGVPQGPWWYRTECRA